MRCRASPQHAAIFRSMLNSVPPHAAAYAARPKSQWNIAHRARGQIWQMNFPGHLPGVATPVGTCAAKGLIRRQSTKKPIRVFLNRCRWFLKQLIEIS